MHVLITSPRGNNQEYDVAAVSGTNAQGEFSILPNHTHFLTIITGEVHLFPQAVFNDKSEPIKIEVGTGILRCTNDQIEIYRNLVTIAQSTQKTTIRTPKTIPTPSAPVSPPATPPS